MQDKKNTLNIFIVGSFGVGKSTIGQRLARKLKKPFYDIDQLIVERSGVDLSWIFDVEGEEGFQRREHDLLYELCSCQGAVIATGGSLALLPENIDLLLAQNSRIIYLYSTIEQQIKHILHNRYKRPLLRVEDVETCLRNLREKCNACYEKIAHFKFSTHNETPSVILKNILNKINGS